MPIVNNENILHRWINRYKLLLDRLIDRYALSDDKTLEEWQVTVLFLIFFYTAVFGLFACLNSVFLTIKMGKYSVTVFYVLIYALILLLTFGRFIPFKTRAWIGTSAFYIMGVINLLKFGPNGSGRLYMFVFFIIACLTLGLRAGIVALVLNGVTLSVIGWLLHEGVIVWGDRDLMQLSRWIAATITFLFLSLIVIFPLSVVVSARDKRLLTEIKLSENLRRVNRQYKQENIERKLVEKELRESEEKFLKAFQINPAAMAIISVEKGCFIDVNDTFKRMFGNNNGNHIGEPVEDLNIWVNQDQKDYIRSMVQGEKPVNNYEIFVYKANQGICRGLFSADIINLKGKKFLLAMMVDVSESSRN